MKSVSDITAFLNHSIAHTHIHTHSSTYSCVVCVILIIHASLVCLSVSTENVGVWFKLIMCVERDTCFMLYCHTENVRPRKSLKSDSSSCIDSGWGSRLLTLELSKLSSPPQTQNAEHKPAIYTEKETLAQQLCRASNRQWLLKGTYYRNTVQQN